MPFEARKTEFMVFTLIHELYNLIKGVFNMNFSLNQHKHTHIKTPAES